MNVLLLSSRFPWPPITGDRVRATIWLSALEREHEVTLVSPPGVVPPDGPRIRFHPAVPSLGRLATSAVRVARGAPLQMLLAGRYDWRDAIHRARTAAGSFDATVVLLSRLDPAVRDVLPDGLRVLDAVDSLRRSMIERASAATPLRAWLWRLESERMRRVESEARSRYDRIVVVSDDEAVELGAVAISNGVTVSPLASSARPYDFGFWGRLGYFANSDAAAWLLERIWPRIRARTPRATLLIAGADAPPWLRGAHGHDGVVVESPVDDMAATARQIRVALFPVRYGTGQSNKVLEAAEAGCAIVSTPKAIRGLEALASDVIVAPDEAALVAGATVLTTNEEQRVALAGRLRATVESRYAREDALARLARLLDGKAAA